MPRAKASKIGDAARQKLAEALGLTFVLALERLENATPVDTTHASTNWVGSVGKPYTAVAGSRESPSRAAQLAGKARVRAYSGKDIKAGRKLFIRNNVFYVKFLNRGSSQQAPARFVERALAGKGSNAMRHMPKGARASTRKMLARMARTAYKRGRGL